MEKRGLRIDIFSVVGLVFLLVIVEMYVSVFLQHEYPILTTEEEMEEFKIDNFGVFADYI